MVIHNYHATDVGGKTSLSPKTQIDSGDERDIIIGLDFGTACTKVAICDDALGEVYAVPFGRFAYDGHPYLIATQVYVGSDGYLNLENGPFIINNLKVELLRSSYTRKSISIHRDMDFEATALDVCVGYLALVIREACVWFLDVYADAYRQTRLVWQLNIGIPSRSYDDKSQNDLFRILALAAWRTAMRMRGDSVTIESIQDAIESSRQDIGYEDHAVEIDDDCLLHPADVMAVPEVIAEIVGYARSDLRREGTHLLVDIGASTLDVATFILHSREDEDRFSLLTTEVEQLGAFTLHHHRIKNINIHIKEQLRNISNIADGISPLPDLESYKPEPIDGDSLRKIDGMFREQCTSLIGRIVHETRTRRNPLAYVWKEGLPVFLCGGGYDIRLYRDAIELARQRTSKDTNFDLMNLPTPRNFQADDLTPREYNRLAVAYGLSTRQDRIGGVIPPSAIDDISPQKPSSNWHDNYIGSEMT